MDLELKHKTVLVTGATANIGLIVHAQLCNVADLSVTTDYAEEAAGNRLTPGDGVFPLAAFLRALPADIPLELEVPQPPDRPALERVRHIVDATRRLMITTERQSGV